MILKRRVRQYSVLVSAWMIVLQFFGLSGFAQTLNRARWKGTTVKEGDVTVVKNPREPLYATQAFSLEEDYVLGGEAEEGRYILSHPYYMALDATGNLYVADAGERNIKVFDKNGKYSKTIGRPGQGPGEFQFPTVLRILPEANEIIVFDLQRILVLSLGGAPLRQYAVKGMSSGFGADNRGSLFLSTTAIPSGQTILKAYAPDMSRELGIVLTYQEDRSSDPFKPRAIWILDRDGRVVFGDAKSYEFKIIDAQGRLLEKISRDYEPVRPTQAERDDLIGRTSQVLGTKAAKSMVFSSYHSAFRAFFVDDLGHLFVETWERSADGRQDIYDIFDEEGRYIARVPLNPHPDFLNPRPRFIQSGKLYTIEPDPKGYEVVKRYTVKWNIPLP
jgi:hypothetical protein